MRADDPAVSPLTTWGKPWHDSWQTFVLLQVMLTPAAATQPPLVALGLRRFSVAAPFATADAATVHTTVHATVVVRVEDPPVHSAADGRRLLPDPRGLPHLPQAVCCTIALQLDLLCGYVVGAAEWRRQLEHRVARPRR